MEQERTNKRIVRSIHSDFKTRDSDDGKKHIEGYFAVFNSDYELWPGATESVDSHAFDNTLSRDIRALQDHDTRLVIGRNKAHTLTLKVDERGLWGDVIINEDDQDALNLYARVNRGDVDQCSFGFEINKEEFEERADGTVHWTIKDVNLFEVSVVTFPAYESTSVSARKNELSEIKKRSVDVFKRNLMTKLKGGQK